MHLKRSWFTLVELIVVITILAILWTIAFISLQWYSENARDSKRVADINNIKKALEFFVLNSEIYPMPDEVWAASYSWTEIYYQWRLWDNVTQNLSRNLKEVPRDPVTEEAYIYSVTEDQQQYEITVVYESSVAHSPFSQAHADLSEWIVAISWNYNGLYVQTDNYAVPLPSITTAASLPVALTSDTIQSQMTAWWSNKPSIWWVPAQTWALDINLSVYEWKVDVTSSNTDKIAFVQAIQWAYAWSSLAQWWSIYEEIVSKTSDADIVAFANGAIASTDWEAVPEVLQCPEWQVLNWEVCAENFVTFWDSGSDTLPLNVNNGSTIVINTSITSSNKANFDCKLWYESGVTPPKYWFEWSGEDVVVKTEWGCVARDYTSVFLWITNLVPSLTGDDLLYDESDNLLTNNDSGNMAPLPCDAGFTSTIGAGYYFDITNADITVIASWGCEENGLAYSNFMFHHDPYSQSSKSFIMQGGYNIWSVKNEAINIDVTEDWSVEFKLSHPSGTVTYFLQFNFNYNASDLSSAYQYSTPYYYIRFTKTSYNYPPNGSYNNSNDPEHSSNLIRLASEGSKIQLGYEKNNSRYFVKQYFMDGTLYREAYQSGTPTQGRIPFYIYKENSGVYPVNFSGVTVNGTFLP
jgi:type II secretory pathway pseudopilin PulG